MEVCRSSPLYVEYLRPGGIVEGHDGVEYVGAHDAGKAHLAYDRGHEEVLYEGHAALRTVLLEIEEDEHDAELGAAARGGEGARQLQHRRRSGRVVVEPCANVRKFVQLNQIGTKYIVVLIITKKGFRIRNAQFGWIPFPTSASKIWSMGGVRTFAERIKYFGAFRNRISFGRNFHVLKSRCLTS